MENNLRPVLLGADMNCYSVARAFHEAYGATSQAFGRYAMGETKYSRIVYFKGVEDLDRDEVMVRTLLDYARLTPDKTRILLGCTDDYAAMAIRNREALSDAYIVPYIDDALAQTLVSKEQFYKHCDRFDIPYPATVLLYGMDDLPALESLPFAYPVILKPSSSIEYWKHPFEGMRKVYEAQDAGTARAIASKIFASGYKDSLVIQDRIPGRDNRMRVLTAYCDQHAKVKMVCLGNVLLEEHTPKARGNHAAILTEYNEELMRKLSDFLEAVGYTGFANFDIKYDERDGRHKVFEINLRQGRSNYYVTGAGLNIAKYLVEDRVENRDLGEPLFYKGDSFWHSIPAPIVWAYTGDAALVEKAKAIAAAGKNTTALDYAFDTRLNPKRWFYLKVHYRRYYKKYATHCEKP